ncbi:hypothetical protein LR48_Vigan07g031600 [Vigna angularis]|uniref:Bifunctional inhibitor/plant lipid transfer protein/seed storage helical domain-containing protein n=2 Tax=Phaseolus angularis TaxID=3914 RepID=A0A0L9UVL4_PHAAN|nr:hypothetical protein LR48_Vigan07g031600 [Vigna angularis]BAT80832.1 hypothetical protein VIGAN_03044300 [Vigna angularis var. angularis]
MKIVFVSFFIFLAVSVFTTDGLTCEEEKTLVKPCLDYLTKKTDSPSTSCCDGLKQIISSTPTKEEKIDACKCLEESGSDVPNLDKDRANNLRKDCKINVYNFMSDDLDCQKLD